MICYSITMTDPVDNNNKKASDSAFSVAASPFNAIKLELVIILIVGFVLWLVLNSITNNDLTHIAVLFLYSTGGAIWLSLRVRRVVRQISENKATY